MKLEGFCLAWPTFSFGFYSHVSDAESEKSEDTSPFTHLEILLLLLLFLRAGSHGDKLIVISEKERASPTEICNAARCLWSLILRFSAALVTEKSGSSRCAQRPKALAPPPHPSPAPASRECPSEQPRDDPVLSQPTSPTRLATLISTPNSSLQPPASNFIPKMTDATPVSTTPNYRPPSPLHANLADS